MKPIVRYRLLLVLIIGMLLYSCQQDDEFLESQQNIKPEIDYSNTNDIVLGEKLENPYAVATMKKALSNLNVTLKKAATAQASAAKTADVINTITVKPTHLYIKFLPKSEEELSILQSDSTLILYSYPLDYEIVAGSGYYRDPEVPAGQPTYQYCAVTIDKQLPSEVEHEILEELYIPDEDKIEESSNSAKAVRSAGYDTAINELVDEALRITNNLEKTTTEEQVSESGAIEITPKKLFRRRPKWRPAGTIKVWDDNIGQTTQRKLIRWERKETYDYTPCYSGDYSNCPKRIVTNVPIYKTVTTTGSHVGVEGVKVRARRWFTTHRGIADANGRYSCDGRFRRPANYSIDWERYHFALQDGWLNGATYNGPKKTGDWNLNLRSDKQAYYATIFRAAHHYYYKDIKGLRRPPLNSFWRTQMKIRAYKENERSTHKKGRRFLGSQIHMKAYGKFSQEIYETTIHELAHASHWNMSRSKFDDTQSIVKESWAVGVQQELTRMIYHKRNPTYGRLNYTEIAEDLIDGNKVRRTSYWYDFNTKTWCTDIQTITRTYNDNVSGFTIRQLEDALREKLTWNSWRDNLKSIHNLSTATNTNIDTAFNYWNTK